MTSIFAMFPHGIGFIGGANLDAGIGKAGASAQFSYGAGAFSNGSIQTFMSDGDVAYIGSLAATYPSQSQPPTVVGMFAGAGGGGFLTNATTATQLTGPFNTWTVNFGAGLGIPSAQVAWGYDAAGNLIWEGSVQFGPGIGASFLTYQTTTESPSHW